MSALYESFELDDIKYEIGECVLIRSSASRQQACFIGKIEEIGVNDDDHITLKLRWYYRPEETTEGRQWHHGDHEVLSSDHYDTVFIETIEAKAAVVDAQGYRDLANTVKKFGSVGVFQSNIFCCRLHYNIVKQKAGPKLEVHCVCNRPENLDKPMIACDDCNKWYHGGCINLSQQDMLEMTAYICDACQPKKKA